MAKKKQETREDARRRTLVDVAREVEREMGAPEVVTPERIAEAYARHFDTEDGRIVLDDLKAKFHGSCVRLRPRGIDPYETHYREGQRDLYLHLVEMKTPPPKPQEEESPE